MSLNNVNFSQKSIADLYRNVLIGSSENTSVLKENKNDKIQNEVIGNFKYLGENKKKILVVVTYPEVVFIPDKQLSFLTTLLAACKLSLADSAVFNLFNYSKTDLNERMSFFNPSTVFLFGVEPSLFGMPILFPHFQIQNYKESTFLFTPGLDEIEKDKALKTKLWICLKKIFDL